MLSESRGGLSQLSCALLAQEKFPLFLLDSVQGLTPQPAEHCDLSGASAFHTVTSEPSGRS